MIKWGEPLICYVFIPDTCQIDKYIITDWELSRCEGVIAYICPKRKTKMRVKAKYLDKLVGNKWYTFNNNDSKALGDIYNAIKNRSIMAAKHFKTYRHWNNALKSNKHDYIFQKVYGGENDSGTRS